jgi:hypothetical protein
MAERNEKDKAEAKEKKPQKPPEYRRFERLLKQIIKAPPLRKHNRNTINSEKI